MKQRFDQLMEWVASGDRLAMGLTRAGLIVVLLWIGGLKAFRYEADGIIPFVANSPAMSFFLGEDRENYAKYKNPEGKLVPENRAWHEKNHTYPFAIGLGTVIVSYGVLLSLHRWKPGLAAIGGLLVFQMSFVTLSFLITTPETWVPNLGDVNHGFPYLSGAGRLVLKDTIMMGAGLMCAVQSAREYLRRKKLA